jgi:outer membrane protein
MNKRWLIALAAAAAALPAAYAQDTGNWIVRARAVNLDPANKDNSGTGIEVNSKVIPEVDVSYFLSPNVAFELILTVPQKHTITYESGEGRANLGTLKHLPPTLTAQYHFTGLGSYRPYVGAGINYTRFSDINLAFPTLSLKKSSVGLALQAGVDVPLGGGWLVNADLKWAQISTRAYDSGVEFAKFKVDPVLFGIGVGKRF